MNVNFIVEDSGTFQYLGCATAAKNLFKALQKKIDISYNDTSKDYDIAHFHTFGPRSLWYLKRFKGKTVITAHSTPSLNHGNLAVPWLVNWLYMPIYNRFDHIIAVSEKCKQELVQQNPKPPITTIYNGIDVNRFQPDEHKRKKFRKSLGLTDDDMLILTVAQRTPRKGIYDFLTLAKRFPQYYFLWIGGFPYNLFSKDYHKISKALQNKSKNAIFPGFVEDIFEVYSAADLFFMPSYAEGHSIVMLESLSMKLPMLARDIPEFREAFKDNLQYFTSVDDIREDMFSKEQLQEFKEKTSIVQTYLIDTIADKHIDLYNQLITD
jgi:glycosyltransferase involved in cell wall biosynthesis